MPGDVSCEPLVAKEYVVGTGLQGLSAGPKPVWLGSAWADLRSQSRIRACTRRRKCC